MGDGVKSAETLCGGLQNRCTAGHGCITIRASVFPTSLLHPSAVGNPAVTTGDAVQAAAALLIHAAHRRPLLPVVPQSMAAMVLLPTPKDFFGNAVRMLSVSLPAGTQQPAVHDALGALRALAGGIRQATIRFRSDKVRQRLLWIGRHVLCLAETRNAAGAPTLADRAMTAHCPPAAAANQP